MKILLPIVAFFVLTTVGMAQGNPLAENLEAKLMPGIQIDPGTGGALDLIVTPKKLDLFVKPAFNVGGGSKFLSDNQTGQDATLHLGAGLCVYKAFCASRIYDLNDQDQRWLFNVDLFNLYTLVGE